MIGFAGYAFSQPDDPESALSTMAASIINGAKSLHWVSIIKPHFGACFIARRGEQFGLAESEDCGVVLAVQGQFASKTFAARTSDHRGETNAQTLLQHYTKGGIEALCDLNGRYSVVIWNGRTHEILMVNDRLGMRRLCWARSHETFLFGTEYKPFLDWPGISRELDDQAVAEFISVAYPMEERTFLRDVKLAPPGSIGRVTSKDLTWTSYLKETCGPTWENISLNECADRLGEVLDEVVSEYASAVEGPLVIPVSGGLDSRVLLGFAKRAGINSLKTVSYGHSHTYDVRFGRSLAHAAGAPHQYLFLPNSYVQKYADEEISVTEGETAALCFHNSILKEVLPLGSTLWTGFLGDVLSGGHLNDYSHIGSEEQRVDQLFADRYLNAWSDSEIIKIIVNPESYEIFDRAPKDTLRSLMQVSGDQCFEKRAIQTELAQRQRRFITYHLETLGRHFNVIHPFYDKRIIQAFQSIPVDYLFGQRAYKRMIVRFMPELAKVKCDKTLQTVVDMSKMTDYSLKHTMTEQFWNKLHPGIRWRLDGLISKYRLRHLSNTSYESIKCLLAKASGGWCGDHNRKAYAHYDQVIRDYKSMFSDVLSDDTLLAPYFKSQGVLEILNKHVRGELDATMALFNVWTFALWRKKFNR
ncbi:MAG: asparagine synthetase B family protein [Desulfuromonadales bacterium]|nr:MAG: asparagine synthetase B family protein [Desulfuromonadales bacterium]